MVKGNKHTHTHARTHTQMEAVNFVRLFYRQPSTCLTIESPSMSVFFL